MSSEESNKSSEEEEELIGIMLSRSIDLLSRCMLSSGRKSRRDWSGMALYAFIPSKQVMPFDVFQVVRVHIESSIN